MKKFPKGDDTYGADNYGKYQCPPAGDQQSKKGSGYKSCNPSFQVHVDWVADVELMRHLISNLTEPPFTLLVVFENSNKFILSKIGP